MMGPYGEGMNFYLFKIHDENGNNKINASEKGFVEIIYKESSYSWTLPLPCLMPLKYCPIDNAEMKGNWEYCPFHGEKLNK